MDTTLFYSDRMALSETKALMHCERLTSEFHKHGGVLTINWHTRSLSPERNWDDFYIELLGRLKTEKVWFTTARQAVDWFRKRRFVQFDDISITDNSLRVRLKTNDLYTSLQPMSLRLYVPTGVAELHASHSKHSFMDISWNGEPEVVLPYQTQE
jgi:hypothetical protein